jgi:mannitol-1-phosphate 5-dehydrogenase
MSHPSQPPVLIIGAGKIARGYIGHLLYLSGFPICFVDVNQEVVRLLNERGRYTVHILGNEAKSGVVTGVQARVAGDVAVAPVVAQAPLAFIAVGGPNLPDVARLLADGLQARRTQSGEPLNVIVCENWHRPAQVIRSVLEETLDEAGRAYLGSRVGIAEATVLRSCIEPTPEQRAADPLAVQAQDYWELQLDAAALVAGLPAVTGLTPIENFYGALERKLYTYNAANATMSYLGVLRGHTLLAEAANDPLIQEIVQGVFAETGAALCAKYGYTREDQEAFAARALRKFQDRTIVDPLERQVRDPIRKLGRHDRLVGAASLALGYGIQPANLALAIAAALRYANAADPAAVRLQAMLRTEGLAYVFSTVCGIDPEGPLARLVRQRQPDVDAFATAA